MEAAGAWKKITMQWVLPYGFHIDIYYKYLLLVFTATTPVLWVSYQTQCNEADFKNSEVQMEWHKCSVK